jgi:hypothetical protein
MLLSAIFYPIAIACSKTLITGLLKAALHTNTIKLHRNCIEKGG